MATKNAESSIQGLNIISTDPLSDELSPMSDDINRDLEAQLAMWTNFQFPTSSSYASGDKSVNVDGGDEDVRIFSPERDTASRSRHKAAVPIEDFASSAFFGNVGASLLAAHAHHPASERGGGGGHAAAHERAKLQQLQQHLQHNQGGGGAVNTEHDHHAINDLFSYLPYDASDLGPALVDPFLNPSEYTAGVGVGVGLPPLTIRTARDASIRQQIQMQMQQMQTIDPSTTTLSHPHPHPHPRPIIPLPSSAGAAKRGAKGTVRPNIIIPVDRALEYALHPPSSSAAAASTIGDDDDEHEHDDDPDHEMHDSTGLNNNNPHPTTPQQLDAAGQPIPYSAAEDKRRRNTLASARFRQKKKEREAAMERKARDLDDRVAGLERECESLRKENRMLRGLLVDGVPAPGAGGGVVVAETNGGVFDVEEGKNASVAAAAGVGAGASVVLLEELVRLLRANSAVLQPTAAGGVPVTSAATSASTSAAGGAARSTTGKRKRGGAAN